MLGLLCLLVLQHSAQAENTSEASWAWLLEPVLADLLALRPAENEIRISKKVPLLTPDGTTLLADLYHPLGKTPAPTILVRIPLDANDTGALLSELLGRLWGQRGYNVMIQGVRGRFGSGGEHLPFSNPAATETEDGIATLRWLNRQPWHNGRTGMWGGSYFGYTQWALAEQSELGLEALFIQIASSDHRALFYPGGALAYETAMFWAGRSHSASDTPFSHEAMLKAMQSGPPLRADERLTGSPVPFYRDWLAHPQADAYWQRADGQQRAARLKMPALLMAGWYDPFLPSQLADYRAIQTQGAPRIAYASRLIIGPWSHAETMTMPDGYSDTHYRLASLKPALDWYDQHLLGRGLHFFAPVRLFISGVNQWRNEQAWPLQRAVPTPFYLAAGQQLSLKPATPASDSYTHDPQQPLPSLGGAILLAQRSGPWPQNALDRRSDRLVYTSEPLKDNLEVTGEPEARLQVMTSAPNTDFVVKLLDVHPNGQAYALTQGIRRQSYTPGQKQSISVQLWPMGHVFLKGHRLGVEVASSHFPMFDVNPNTGENPLTATRVVTAQQTVYTGSGELSQVLLPVIPVE